MAHDHHEHQHHHHHDHLGEILDLDADVLHAYHREVFSWIGARVPANAHVVDLGTGRGNGALALAQRLPDADVVAVDVSEEMLEHLRDKAATLGLADRVRTVAADLDGEWPDFGPADLLWASASLHHLADPDLGLRQALAALRPGGLFAVTEIDSFPRFLTGTADAALEDRYHDAMAAMRSEAGMHIGADWRGLLTRAGFDVEEERRVDIFLTAPLTATGRRYAYVSFERARERLEGRVSDEDLAALDTIVATLPDRDDVTLRTHRTVWLARRP